MAFKYSVESPNGEKFQVEFDQEPSNEALNRVIDEQIVKGKVSKGPTIPIKYLSMVDPIRAGTEAVGILGGGAIGTATLGPGAGTAVGAGLGYSGARQLFNRGMETLGVQKPQHPLEALGEAGTDIAKGITAEIAGQTLPKVISGVGKVLSYPWGAYTGSGSTAIREAYKGKSGFTEFMRGKGSEESLVKQAKSGLESLVEDRQLSYSDLLSKIKNPNLPLVAQPEIIRGLKKAENEFGLKFYPGGKPIFFNTRFMTNKTAQQEIETAINTVNKWQDYTPKGVDELKQAIDNLYRRSQPEASTFITKLRSNIKDVLVKNVPEYKQAMSTYKTDTELIKEISKDLSIGDMNTKKQALSKLLSAMKRDDEFTLSLISKLNERTGGKIIPSIAGIQMQSKIPTSLVGKMGGMYEIFQGLSNLSPTEVVGLMASSPRLTGEFLNVLGKFAPTLIKGTGYAPQVIQSLTPPKQESLLPPGIGYGTEKSQ